MAKQPITRSFAILSGGWKRRAAVGCLTAALAFAGTACGGGAPTPHAGALPAAQAKAWLAAHPAALVLDVREASEWNDDLGHIEGALRIPLDSLPARADELGAWRDKPIVVVCRSGRRSAQGARILLDAGYHQVWNLEGGMAAWRAAGN